MLVTAVCWNLGPGVGLWLVLLAGAGGNALTAVAHRADHISVGASTATFGAIGILAALRIVGGRTGSSRRKWWVVVAAGLALLALLGTGPHADILAHLFGFLVGGGLGVIARAHAAATGAGAGAVAARRRRRRGGRRRLAPQLACRSVMPPSTAIHWPVMFRAASLARNATS